MRFQLVTTLLLAFSVFGTSAFAKSKAPKKQEMYVQCKYVNLLTGREDSHWAVNQSDKYAKVAGIKNNDNEFVTSHNKQLVEDFCTYTKRAQYGDRVEFYEEAGTAAGNYIGNSIVPLVFESEAPYPEKIDPEWATKLKPGKAKVNKFSLASISKLAFVVGSIAAVWKLDPTTNAKLTSAMGTAMLALNFVEGDTFDFGKAEKVLDKVEKTGKVFTPKKDDPSKEQKDQLEKEQLKWLKNQNNKNQEAEGNLLEIAPIAS